MSAEGFGVGLVFFFKGKFRENSSIRKTVTIRWWWIRGGEKGAEGTDTASSVCGTGAELPEASGGFPTPQSWEKGWRRDVQLLPAWLQLLGKRCQRGEGAAQRGYLSPSVPSRAGKATSSAPR